MKRLISTALILTLAFSFSACKKNTPLETSLSEITVIEEKPVEEIEEITNVDETEESIVDESEVVDEITPTPTSSTTTTPTNTPTNTPIPTSTNNGGSGSTTESISVPVTTQPTVPTADLVQPQPTATPVPTTPPTPTPESATPTPRPTIVRAYATISYNYAYTDDCDSCRHGGVHDASDTIDEIEVHINSCGNWYVSAAGGERYEAVNAERHPDWVWKSSSTVINSSVHDILWSDGVVTQTARR